MKLNTKTTALVLLSILAPASVFAIYPMFSSPDPYGPKTPNMLIHIYSNPDNENMALEECVIDIGDWPLSKYWIDKWVTNPDIKLHSYDAIDDFEFDLNNQRWPTGVTEPREYDPETASYKHWYGTAGSSPLGTWDDEARYFRIALAYLTDKDRYITEILQSYGYRKDTPVPIPALQEYTDYASLEANNTHELYPITGEGLIYHYDPCIAAVILDAAGFVQGTTANPYYDPATPCSAEFIRIDPRYGGDLSPLVFYARLDDPNRRAAAEMMTFEMRKAGIPVDLRLVEKTVCYKQVEVVYDYHLYTGGWSLSPDIDYLYHLFHSSMYCGGTAMSYFGGIGWCPNYPGVCNHHLDNELEKLKYATTFVEVLAATLNAQEIHAQYVPTIPLWSSAGVKAYKTGWEGTVSMVGECKDNYWSFLNMYNPLDDTIDWGFKSNPEGLNVITAEWQWDRKVLRLIYDSLIDYNPYNLGEEFGWLAESWSIGTWDTGKMYTLFTLRPGITFHDGSPLIPQDVKFSVEFTKACGVGVAWTHPVKNGGTFWTHNNLRDVDHVDTQAEDASLGPRDVKVYFNVESYWALHWVGFLPIIHKDLWMTANAAYGWGYDEATNQFVPEENRFKVREWNPWETDVNSNGVVDLREDGTGAWIFVGADPLLIEWIALEANHDFYLSQEYLDAYKRWAFHQIGDVNDDGIIDWDDLLAIQKALGTDMWNYPWGTDWGEYNPAADINVGTWDMATGTGTCGDGYIDIADYAIAERNRGRSADGIPTPSNPPEAIFDPTTCTTFYVCDTILFDATASTPGFDGDDNCPIVEYRWDFGDGNTTTISSPTITHHYDEPGDYNVTLTVYAPGIPPLIAPGYVEYDNEVHTIHIKWRPYSPTADFWPSTSTTFYVCELVLFDATASTPGFDGDDTCPIIEYRWDFGDATSLVTTDLLATHHYTTPGDYNVNLTVYAPGIGPFIDPDYDPYDSEVHTIHIVSKLEPRKLIDIVEFPGTVILEEIPVDETLLAKFAAMEGFNEVMNLLIAKGYNFTTAIATASRVTGGLDENTFSGVVLSWWSDVGPKGTRALIAAALMNDNTTMVLGVVTNLLPPELAPEDHYIIVDAMPYVYVEWYWWAWSPIGKIVRWSYWWYDSHSHPNWYWGCYWWWRTYIKTSLPPTGLPHWLPWWWWYWHWTYWKHWYWWSTYFPYDP